jgi:leucyl aminopeptidase
VDYRPARKSRGTVVLLGKTVTFDSGGLSLKPGKGMETMKGDMGGGASVLGAVDALAGLHVPVRVVAVLPAVENMPGGTATRPGDVVTSMSGLTVEILNTDAEGRLTLADGLVYAGRFRPDAIVDIATLTGACMVAVGPHRAGLFCDDRGLRDMLMDAGDAVGERVWPLPLDREYDDLVRSDVADLKNISGSREGGAIVAAVFLRRFVPKDTAWAHIDIAGREFSSEDRPYGSKGATGFGTRLLTRFVRDWAAARSS